MVDERGTFKSNRKMMDSVRRFLVLRRIRRRFHTISVWRRNALPFLVILMAVCYFRVWTSDPDRKFLLPGPYYVDDVIDAFHLVLRRADGNETHRVRILGVEPISEQKNDLQRQAAIFMRDTCLNRIVRVHLGRRRLDQDQTLLAHIYLDDKLLSAELIRHRLARNSLLKSDSSSIAKILRDAEEEATARLSSF